MRKYRQLLLLIVTFVSFTLLLVYRHEYNRLHYVLEMFNFFGQPCNMTELIEINTLANHHDWGPEPFWTVNEDLHVYSSFWLPSNEVKTIVARSEELEHSKKCFLWYEDKEEAVIGKFKFAPVGRGDMFEFYYYFCSSSNKSPPYAVSYTRYKKQLFQRHLVNFNPDKIAFNVTVCAPVLFEATKTNFIEFLSYHPIIGVDSFIIYSNRLPHSLIKLISNLSAKLNINITFYNWNFEESKYSKSLIEQDCVLRASKHSKFVTTLNVDEYIVPSTHYSLMNILSQFNENSDKLTVAVQKICVEHKDSYKPIALQNTGLIRDDSNVVQTIYRNNNEDNLISAEGVDRGFMSIHKYVHCSENDKKGLNDKSILKFSTDFIRSTLFQLLLHKQL